MTSLSRTYRGGRHGSGVGRAVLDREIRPDQPRAGDGLARRSEESVRPDHAAERIELDQARGAGGAEHLGEAGAQIGHRRQRQDLAAVVLEREARRRAGDRRGG